MQFRQEHMRSTVDKQDTRGGQSCNDVHCLGWSTNVACNLEDHITVVVLSLFCSELFVKSRRESTADKRRQMLCAGVAACTDPWTTMEQ